ncbi:MAG: D-alanine--D-alanine ligase [Nitrospirae bacterium]|nr:D-alanine--D-alanine ligase [Nitrospirota bacterium]
MRIMKRVGVLMGGMSSEREISLKSGRLVAEALKRRGYDVVPLDVDREVAAALRREKVEAVFIALHGRYGEDGAIQGLLEVMGIPYTGSGVLASAVGMNKIMTKRILESRRIPTPASIVVRRDGYPGAGRESIRRRGLRFPWVVKPSAQGSTIGVRVVDREELLEEALGEAFRYDPEALVEEFIPGREVTAGILGGEPLPLVEIVPKESFYDYATKTTAGMAEYRVPAPLPLETTRAIQSAALDVHRAVGCRGVSRVDFRVDPTGRPFVLEINTVPGMTETSLLPQAARAAGIDYDTLVERILESAFRGGDPVAP